MRSSSECLTELAGLLVLLSGCPADRADPDRAQAAAPTKLCDMPVSDLHQVRLGGGSEVPVVEVTGPVGSFRFDNMGSERPKTCAFELSGRGVEPERVFSRYGRKDKDRVRFTLKTPGRVLVEYTVPGRSYGLISVEPPVEPPPDAHRFEHAGIGYKVTGGALLRIDAGQPRIRSLGPATRIELANPGPKALGVNFLVDNTSDRLSRPVLTGLDSGRTRRVGKLGLRVTGTLQPKAEASLALEPRPLTRPWSFVFGGDVKQQLGTYLQLLEQVRLKHDPLFMIGAGDYTRNCLPNELAAYFQRTADVPFPVYPIKGNHELRAQGERHYPRLFGPDRFAFTVDGVLFVLLDSTGYVRSGDITGFSLGDAQLAWLDEQLSAHASATLKFVGLHSPPHPLHGDSLRPDYPANLLPSEAARLFSLAIRHGVSYVLSGHAHLYARAVKDGTVYLTSGGGGAKLYSHNPLPGFTIDTRKHLMLLTVSASGVDEHRIMLPRPSAP